MKARYIAAAAALLSLSAARQVAAATTTMCLSIANAPGDAPAPCRPKDILVTGWSWGDSTPFLPTGQASGKRQSGTLNISTAADRSWPAILQTDVSGQLIPNLILGMYKLVNGIQLEFVQLNVRSALIVSDQIISDASGNLSQELSLSFAAAQYSYTPISPDGTTGATVTVNFNW